MDTFLPTRYVCMSSIYWKSSVIVIFFLNKGTLKMNILSENLQIPALYFKEQSIKRIIKFKILIYFQVLKAGKLVFDLDKEKIWFLSCEKSKKTLPPWYRIQKRFLIERKFADFRVTINILWCAARPCAKLKSNISK